MTEAPGVGDTLVTQMQELRAAVGYPTLRSLAAHADRAGATLPVQTLSAILKGERQRPNWDTVLAFVQACERCAASQRDKNHASELFDRGIWHTLWQSTSNRRSPDPAATRTDRPHVHIENCTGVVGNGENATISITVTQFGVHEADVSDQLP